VHFDEKPSGTYEDMLTGKYTFPIHNRKTVNEVKPSKELGTKIRVETIYEKRNGLGMTSQGDKIYKHPDYAPDYFKEGGLAVGSSNSMFLTKKKN